MNNIKEEVFKKLRAYYLNKKIPNTVTEYAKDYPPGYSRTMLKSSYDLTVSEVLYNINDTYIKSNDSILAKNNLDEIVKKLNLTLLNSYTNKHTKLEVRCNICNDINITTYDSIKLSKYGCRVCANNKPLTKESAITKLKSLSDRYLINEDTIISESINRSWLTTNTIEFKCLDCNTVFTRNASYCYYRGNNKMCPSCNPSKVRPVTYKNITFNSTFEYECYKLLEEYNPITHFKYKSIIKNCTNQYVGDFLIANTIIEVTSYNANSEYDKFKKHTNTLSLKQDLAIKAGFSFYVIRSLPELENLIKDVIQDIV